ncbi:MAG: hypothetical protein HGA47_01025 [Zoogloea sp.]|nr:hypothetical protein [Zoogloea sp.]
MTPSGFSLRRHLGWIVAIKLIALFALWWFFVRDTGSRIDPETVARQFAPNPATQGEPNGQ